MKKLSLIFMLFLLVYAGAVDQNEPSSFESDCEPVARLYRAINESYSYRDLVKLDWPRLFKVNSRPLERAEEPREFAEITAKMLARAKDPHLWVKVDDKSDGGFKPNAKRNYNMKVLEQAVPNWRKRNDRVYTGRFEDDIGYIMITNWSTQNRQSLDAVFSALEEFSDCKSLIIDVRPNGGGGEGLAREVAGCFVEQPVLYAKHVCRDVSKQDGWGQVQERMLKPNEKGPKYRGNIVVLMGQANMSSCEAFLLMMKQVPNCKLIGEKSYGSSGNPQPHDLGNGVTVWLPSWKALRPDGTCFEREGIKPDITVKTSPKQLQDSDKVLRSALKYLRKGR